MKVFKFTDNVPARMLQIFQEAALLNTDRTEAMRAIKVYEVSPGVLDLTPDYINEVREEHKKMVDEAPVPGHVFRLNLGDEAN